MNNSIHRMLSVFLKDLKSEFRTRYAISAIVLFILTTISMLVFSMRGLQMNAELSAALLWVLMFFGSMTGLSKSFVSEQERQTALLLSLSASNDAVYFGKLLFNILLSLTLNLLAAGLFLVFFDSAEPKEFFSFILILLTASIGMASATTIISAIIAKASSKGALFPVLSFPLVLPLIIVGIEATINSISGTGIGRINENLLLMLAYSGIVITASFMLFDFVWKD